MPAHDWTVFIPFSGLHLLTVAGCGLAIGAVVAIGHRLRDTRSEIAMRRALAAFIVAFWVVHNIWLNWPVVDVYGGLPLHVCDIGGLIAPLALLTGNRWLRATLYFWVTALTLQAFIQPELSQGPATMRFWLFWISHSVLVACAAYDLVVLRFRPDRGDLGRAGVASLAYVAAIIPLNLLLGTNYGFVGNPPADRSLPPLVAALGPWPGRVGIMMVLAGVAFTLALAPWLRRDRAGAATKQLRNIPRHHVET
jgi:hypothetical integral membrane protein (TIGR02206 family)